MMYMSTIIGSSRRSIFRRTFVSSSRRSSAVIWRIASGGSSPYAWSCFIGASTARSTWSMSPSTLPPAGGTSAAGALAIVNVGEVLSLAGAPGVVSRSAEVCAAGERGDLLGFRKRYEVGKRQCFITRGNRNNSAPPACQIRPDPSLILAYAAYPSLILAPPG